jgi:hypothetical protein
VSTRIDVRQTQWLRTIYLVLFGWVLSVYQTTAVAQFDPSADLYRTNFSPFDPSDWHVASGQWQYVASTTSYNSTGVGAADVAVVQKYTLGLNSPTGWITQRDYGVDVLFTNQYGSRGNLAGVVYDYVDEANYREAVFSPTGVAYLREVVGGRTTTVASTIYAGGGANISMDVHVVRNNGTTDVKLNGSTDVFVGVPQANVAAKRAGLATHYSRARFDLVAVVIPNGPQRVEEGFESGVAKGWTPISGNWSVVNGVYRDSAVQETNISLLPAKAYTDTQDATVVLSAELYNPYSGRGNLVGFVFGYRDIRNYAEVVFAPTGTAAVRKVVDGKLITLASATSTYNPYKPRVFVDVGYDGGRMDVYLNGIHVLSGVQVYEWPTPGGRVGVSTHWAPGGFDDINFYVGLPPETEDPPQEH